jgi:uncharacterized protein (DUF2147 family)
MKRTILLLSMLLTGFICQAQYSSESVLGDWLSEKKDAKIQLYEQDDKVFGKIIWVQTPDAKDDNNPDIELRKKPLIGLVMLSDFEINGQDSWTGGKIYDPESGKTYSCNMKQKGKSLQLHGYVGLPMFGRTSVWTRP